MCKSLAEGGQRCYSHANKDYQNAKGKLRQKDVEIDRSRLELESIKNTLERLDIAYELGEVNDEEYNRYQDIYIHQREEQQGIIARQLKEQESLDAEVKRTLNELRTTPTELENLKNEIRNEKDPARQQLLKFSYNQGSRLRRLRQQAFERYQVRHEKGQALVEEAKAKMAQAQNLPEYDYQTRQIKQDAIAEAELLAAQGAIEMNNGRQVFMALFDTKGNQVPAKLQKTKTGRAWGLLSDPKDPGSKYSGFVTVSQSQDPEKREEFYAKKGYSIGTVWAEAKAELAKDENGVKKVRILRNDGGFSPFAETVTTNYYRQTQANAGK